MIPNVVHVNEKCVEKEQHTDDEAVAKKRIKHLPSLGTHSFYHLFCTWFNAYAFVHSACTFHFYKLNFTFLQENIKKRTDEFTFKAVDRVDVAARQNSLFQQQVGRGFMVDIASGVLRFYRGQNEAGLCRCWKTK